MTKIGESGAAFTSQSMEAFKFMFHIRADHLE